MAEMKFKNELTFAKLKARGKEEEFHRAYEAAYAAAIDGVGARYANIVAGRERSSKLGEFPDVCPYDRRMIVAHFAKGTKEDVAEAVRMSLKSQTAWEETKVSRRCDISLEAADRVSKRKYEFAAKLTLDNGKNRFESMAEVDETIDYLRYYAQTLLTNEGYVLELDGPVPCDQTRSVMRPLGVVGVISPFNFPLAITAGMVTGALVTGNAVVLKPASDAPLMARMLHEVLAESGVPSEVLHFVTGSGETVGAELTGNKDIAAIAFTGSRDVGMSVARASAEKGKRPPILEMGGKNPAIVSDKADLDKAVEGVGRSAFGYSGQKCSATSRVIVNRSVADAFTKKLVSWLRDKKVGNPSKRDTFVGPVINAAAVEKFRKAVVLAAKDGQVLTGGHVLEDGPFKEGHFVEPTIIAHLARNHELATKELFLPVLIVLTCSDIDEAIEVANGTEYGLTAGIFSDDPAEVQKFFTRVRAGITYANRSEGATTGALVGVQPFVGWKASGVTGKGAGGPYYLLQFLQEQSRTVCR
ncbi:MAG: hypothetical protein A3K67_01440 [Euryarchaeota archaeon RBG_16_62_10]|nr:MAG: hypothetical protein A3K67_01440 [Euryarchaeota archaeon RBG_16_62_10]